MQSLIGVVTMFGNHCESVTNTAWLNAGFFKFKKIVFRRRQFLRNQLRRCTADPDFR